VSLPTLLAGAANPWGLALAPNGRRLYVTLSGVHEVAIVDVPKLVNLVRETDTPAEVEAVEGDLEIARKRGIARRVDAGLVPHARLLDAPGTPPHSEWEGNLLLNEGIQHIWEDVAGLSAQTDWDNTNARTGVGISSTAPAATQTGLQGATTTYVGMDATYPQRTNQTVDWRSTYGSAVGNHAWEEFTVVDGADGDEGGVDDNLNRATSSEGTKTSGQTWILTISVTLS
jgi:hypothetical protein